MSFFNREHLAREGIRAASNLFSGFFSLEGKGNYSPADLDSNLFISDRHVFMQSNQRSEF